jgi:mono/diheme cytochrome c family protein
MGAGPDATFVAFALRSTASGSQTTAARTTGAPAGAAPAAAVSGEAAYAQVCEACHGARGGGGLAPGLVPMTKDADEVLGIVREGFGQMPPVSSRELSDAQVTAIVEYLKSINR